MVVKEETEWLLTVRLKRRYQRAAKLEALRRGVTLAELIASLIDNGCDRGAEHAE